MGVVEPANAVRLIAGASPTDAVFSPDGKTLFISSGDTVTAYDVVSGAASATYSAGAPIGPIDISPDGRYLLAVGEQVTFTPSGMDERSIYRFDLTTGAFQTYTETSPPQPGIYDATFLSDDKVLFSNGSTGQYSPAVELADLSTGTYSPVEITRPNSMVVVNPTLVASADHQRVLIDPQDAAENDLYLYAANSGVVATYRDTSPNPDPYAGAAPNFGNVSDANLRAISDDGSILVQGRALQVYDGALHAGVTLTTVHPELANSSALAFSPNGGRLFVEKGSEVYALSTGNWNVLAAYPIGEDLTNAPISNYGNALSVSADGRYLSVIGAQGVHLIDLTTAVSENGTSGDDVLVARPDQATLYGFEGNDDLTSSGATPTLMVGGAGNDIYHVDGRYDQVSETGGGGYDTVISSLGSFTLPMGVERLILVGDALNGAAPYGGLQGATIVGNDQGNTLTGSDQSDALFGGGGDDVLAGGRGGDVLDGGAGDDTLSAANGQNTLTGDDGDDVLQGGIGDDRLDGGFGADIASYAQNITAGVTVDL